MREEAEPSDWWGCKGGNPLPKPEDELPDFCYGWKEWS